MSDAVEELHKQVIEMSLGDLCLLAGQMINLGFGEKRVDIILKYLELRIIERKTKRMFRK